MDRPIRHVGGSVLAGGKGKQQSVAPLPELSALLKANPGVCVSTTSTTPAAIADGGKSNNRRLVTSSSSSQPARWECNQWHYLLMPS